MAMFMARSILVSVCLVGAAIALSQPAGTFSLKRVPKADETMVYQTSSTVSVQGVPFEISTKHRVTVVEVKPDGGYITESTQTEGVATFTPASPDAKPQTTALRDYGPVRTTYAPTNRVVEVEDDSSDGYSYRRANLTSFIVEKPSFQVGDAWTVKIAGETKKGSVDIELKYKIEALEMIGEVQTAKISLESKELMGPSPASASGNLWIELRDGSTVKAEFRLLNVPVDTIIGDTTMKFERLAPAEKIEGPTPGEKG